MSKKKLKLRRRANTKLGTAPGTINVDAQSPVPVIDVYRYDANEIEHFENIRPKDIPAPQANKTIWVNIVGFGDTKVVREVAAKFKIHPLAMEDIVNTHQRPKLEAYEDQLYVVLRMANFDGDLELEQVSLFVGDHYILTWQERAGDCFEPIRLRLQSRQRQVRLQGHDFLAYALIDAVVNSFFPILNEYHDAIDRIEDTLDDPDMRNRIMRELHRLRSNIRLLRRSAQSHQNVIRDLLIHESHVIGAETRLHLRDVSDHALLLIDSLESARDSCTDLQDLYMSTVSMRMNEVMKVLTIIATIFMPLSFIAGLYGMNFSTDASPWNMPETQWTFGYPFVLALMLLVGGTMVVYFRRKEWI